MKWIGKKIEQFATIFRGGVVIDSATTLNETPLEINTDSTTANVIDVTANRLTTGHALDISATSLAGGNAINIVMTASTDAGGECGGVLYADVNETTINSSLNKLIEIDYDKTGVTPDEGSLGVYGIHTNIADAATNHSGSVNEYIGFDNTITLANTTGSLWVYGTKHNLTGDTARTTAYYSDTINGGIDFKAVSSASSNDYFTIATTANGATTLKTVDYGAAAAHFKIAADGDITLDSAGQIKLEPVAGNNILLDGTITIDAGVVTGATSITSTAFVGDLTGAADTVATISGLAPNTATTQASQPNITGVGTIGTGVWEGTAVASDQQKHLMHYVFSGYTEGNGSTYEMPVVAHDNQAPFEHNTSTGADGLDALTIQNQVRTNGKVMPRAVTLKKWTGWVTGEGTGSVTVGLFKLTPADDSTSTVSPVLLDAFTFTAANNGTSFGIDETTFTLATVAAGDIVFTGIKAVNNKDVYFTSTLEVEF